MNTRRQFLMQAAGVAAALPMGSRTARGMTGGFQSSVRAEREVARPSEERPRGNQAWRELLEGNRRFVEGKSKHPDESPARRKTLSRRQQPIASVLCCSDSRVPPELVFDQGLGTLFVARVAGNIAEDVVTASLEFAAVELAVPLVVVLGHERCGAVTAAVEAISTAKRPEGHLGVLVQALRPSVEWARHQGGDVVDVAVKDNVRRVVKGLTTSGPILEERVHRGELAVIGAYYDLDDGKVTEIH